MYCTYFSQNPLRQLVLDPRVCTGFKSVWVESVVGLVLVGLKIIFNGFRLSWADGNICMGLVEVWFRFETVLSFSLTSATAAAGTARKVVVVVVVLTAAWEMGNGKMWGRGAERR